MARGSPTKALAKAEERIDQLENVKQDLMRNETHFQMTYERKQKEIQRLEELLYDTEADRNHFLNMNKGLCKEIALLKSKLEMKNKLIDNLQESGCNREHLMTMETRADIMLQQLHTEKRDLKRAMEEFMTQQNIETGSQTTQMVAVESPKVYTDQETQSPDQPIPQQPQTSSWWSCVGTGLSYILKAGAANLAVYALTVFLQSQITINHIERCV